MYETKKQLLQKVPDGDKEEEATAGFDATIIKKKNHIAQLAASIQLVMFFKLIGNHKVLERVLFERSCRFLLCFQTLQWYFYESVVLEGCSTLKEFGLNTHIFILDQFNQHVASKMFSQYQTVHTGAVNKHLILQITNFLLLETI